jgi:hypothetical protein
MAMRSPLNDPLSKMTRHRPRLKSGKRERSCTEHEQANFWEDESLREQRGRSLPKSILRRDSRVASSVSPRSSNRWSTMGRVATPSVARIYPDVNAKLGPSWHEYGELAAIQSNVCSLSFLPDNLQVQWGSQDHYEIVRKVGRGKYSEVRFFFI